MVRDNKKAKMSLKTDPTAGRQLAGLDRKALHYLRKLLLFKYTIVLAILVLKP
jgi:hypothetical protein